MDKKNMDKRHFKRHSKSLIKSEKLTNLPKKAFENMFGDYDDYTFSMKYSNKFSDYNANVRLFDNHLEFRLSKKWLGVSEEIVIGLLQELLLKIVKKRPSDTFESIYIDLYSEFIKKLHIAIPKTKIDPMLAKSFERVNEKYFFGTVDMPNLVWGKNTVRQMGLYDFKRDRITISGVLKSADDELLDYVMYHEMLHKKAKFTTKNGRTTYHSKAFRRAEQMFDNYEMVEKKLNRLGNVRKWRLFG